ncbi:unnamed protein product [Fusarium graminearum]|uniref:Chromosome 3, complete genome n=1 Tax=Gibberella zeae (strain ATCC MYA-4620 / CBS 123657 / FGSC 9075 / NRRL 31084 / PH-1) TaxID=229533 RepID=A0A0E0SQV9_GIBZE|nr:hypothetical protein FG05_30053 [Fusarium graminearum]CEF88822.1 unnamed protein product [Fusarium graminearum]CZS85000.1 unnamed protein product [Fusarium graminearum]
MSIGIEPGDSHPLIATISYVYDYHGSDNLPKTPMSSSSSISLIRIKLKASNEPPQLCFTPHPSLEHNHVPQAWRTL